MLARPRQQAVEWPTDNLSVGAAHVLEGTDFWGWGDLPPLANRNSATGIPRQRGAKGRKGTIDPWICRF